MKINRLLELHESFQSLGLPHSLGDGYLMANNRIFRGIRERVLKAGYTLTSDRNEAYEAFPLLQLEEILKNKALPYSNNVIPFASLTPAQRAVISWDDVEGNLKRNFVFHEGSHAVFRSWRPLGTSDISLQVLWTLLEESFANTMELLGVIDAGDAAHRIFYEMNSYVCEFEHRANLNSAEREIGEGILIPFLVLCYLHANFLREKITDTDFKFMLRLVAAEKLPEASLKSLRALSKIVFNLSERFRFQTTDFHLRLAGVKTPYDLLHKMDFLKICAEDPSLLRVLKEISQLRFEVV